MIDGLISIDNKLNHVCIVVHIYNKHKGTTIENARKKIRQFIKFRWVKFRDQREDNTVKSMKKFIKRNISYGFIDDN